MKKSEPGPPMTLGNAAAAHVRLIVWCLDCRHQVEPAAAEMAERYGAEMAVPDWHARLVCSHCGSRRVDMVVSGTVAQKAILGCKIWATGFLHIAVSGGGRWDESRSVFVVVLRLSRAIWRPEVYSR